MAIEPSVIAVIAPVAEAVTVGAGVVAVAGGGVDAVVVVVPSLRPASLPPVSLEPFSPEPVSPEVGVATAGRVAAVGSRTIFTSAPSAHAMATLSPTSNPSGVGRVVGEPAGHVVVGVDADRALVEELDRPDGGGAARQPDDLPQDAVLADDGDPVADVEAARSSESRR